MNLNSKHTKLVILFPAYLVVGAAAGMRAALDEWWHDFIEEAR